MQTALWMDETGVACDLSSLVHAQVHELQLHLPWLYSGLMWAFHTPSCMRAH